LFEYQTGAIPSGRRSLLFLAASNGFGMQYLAWLVFWNVLGLFSVVFFQLASGVFLLLAYNCWSGGFPWYLADSYYVGDFTGHLDYFKFYAGFRWSPSCGLPAESLAGFRNLLAIPACACGARMLFLRFLYCSTRRRNSVVSTRGLPA
jgi:hypothetical protein